MPRRSKKKASQPRPKPGLDRVTWALWLGGGLLGTLPALSPALEPLVWIAPVGWLHAATRKGPMLLPAYIAGIIYVGIPSTWLIRTGLIPWLASAMYFAFFTTVGCWALWRTRQRLGWPLWVLGPLVWSACEVTRLKFSPFATTWYNFGNLLVENEVLRQSAEWGTVIALSLLPLTVAGTIVEALLARASGGWAGLRNRRVWGGAVLSASLIAAFWAYGTLTLPGLTLTDGPTVALVQPAVPQYQKLLRQNREEVILHHIEVTRMADLKEADVVFWPESVVTVFLPKEPGVIAALAQLSRDVACPLVIGAQGETIRKDGDRAPTNSAFLLNKEGTFLAQWNKRQLVPLVETLLWVDDIQWLRRKLGTWFQKKFHFFPFLSPGHAPEVAVIPGTDWKMGAAICYDDVLPEITRDLVDRGADVVGILSNEAWFGPMEFHQHVAIARFRAIESRVPIVRATNTGLTCVIDPLGRVVATLPTDQPGVLVQTTQVVSRAALPRWISESYCWGMFWAGLGLLVLTFRRRS